MSVISQYRSALVLNFDARDGDIRERITGQVPSLTGALTWGQTSVGAGVRGTGTSNAYMQWAANSLWDLTTDGTIIVQLAPSIIIPSGISQNLISRITYSPSTRNGWCISGNNGQVVFSLADNTGVSSITVASAVTSPTDNRTVAATWDAATNMKGFLDGERSATGNYAYTPSPSGQVLRIAGFDTRVCQWPIARAIVFNVALPEADIARLYRELQQRISPPAKYFPISPKPTVYSNAALVMNGSKMTQMKVGNLADGVAVGTVGTGGGLALTAGNPGIQLWGNQNISFGDITTMNSINAWTMSAVINMSATVTGGSGIISKGTSATSRIAMVVTDAAHPGIIVHIANGSDTYGSVATSIRPGHPIHILAVYNGAGSTNADRLKIYINGVDSTVTFTGTIPATGPSLAGTNTLVGDMLIGSTHYYFNGIVSRANVYTRAFTAAEAKASYLSWAATPVLWMPAGGRWLVNNTNTMFEDCRYEFAGTRSTFSETVNSGVRVLSSSGNGNSLKTASQFAFGSWTFYASRTSSTSNLGIINSSPTRTTGLGYELRLLSSGEFQLRLTSSTALITSGSVTSSGQLYKVHVTRNTSGRFDLWYRLPTDATWTYVGNGTDTGINVCTHMIHLLDTGNQISRELIIRPGPIDPADLPGVL